MPRVRLATSAERIFVVFRLIVMPAYSASQGEEFNYGEVAEGFLQATALLCAFEFWQANAGQRRVKPA